MSTRLNYRQASPDAFKAMLGLEEYLGKTGLEPALLELVRTRASQLNGCAYCVDMHTADARKGGESERRLYALPVWRDTPFFTDRERAALAWTETLTLVAGHGVGDLDYERVKAQFSDKEVVDLTMAVNIINAWNRIGIGFGMQPAK